MKDAQHTMTLAGEDSHNLRNSLRSSTTIVNELVTASISQWKSQGRWHSYYKIYEDLHRNPGKSNSEFYIVDKVVSFLENIQAGIERDANGSSGSFRVYKDIGGVDGERPGGVVAVIENPGSKGTVDEVHTGPKVMLRADMDALEVTEETGASYTSTVPGVMHACGHDMHTTTLMATVQMMVEARKNWTGTFIALFQPAEETLSGARDMIAASLYDLIPEPDCIMAAHVTPEPCGIVSVTPNVAFSRSDGFEIRITGRGGHGSRPEACIDPIVCAAYCITRIQSIVSRVVPSTEAAVITVGSIRGGTVGNVIPNSVDMQLTMRSNSDDLANLMQGELRRIIAAEVKASNSGAPVAWEATEQGEEEANPRIRQIKYGPLLVNHDGLLKDISQTFTQLLGRKFIPKVPPVSGSEDVAYLTKGRNGNTIPLLYWRYGGTSKELWSETGGDPRKIPSNHSSRFLPQLKEDQDDDPLKTGTMALFAAALTKLSLLP